MSDPEAKLRIPLGEIARHAAAISKSPFGNRAEFIITTDEKDPSASVRFQCGDALVDTEMLKAGMIVGYTANASETHIEGSYWLALIKGPAFPVPESQVHASDQFEAGWLVVKAQWFELVTTSPRCYKLAAEERLLVVNEMIRLAGLKFDKVVKRSPRLGASQYFFGE